MKKPHKLSPVAIGMAIKVLREEKRMSASDLAVQVGLSNSSLSRIENGHRPVSLAEGMLIVGALDTTLEAVISIASQVDSSSYLKQREKAMTEDAVAA